MRLEVLYLTDIVEAADDIHEFLSGIDIDTFLKNRILQSAILQKLAVIGEAAAPLAFLDTFSELLPCATLFVMDGDQHNRLRRAERCLPSAFTRLEATCCIASYLEQDPQSALREFLYWAQSGTT